MKRASNLKPFFYLNFKKCNIIFQVEKVFINPQKNSGDHNHYEKK